MFITFQFNVPMLHTCLLILSIISTISCQRPWYAGRRPIGYPEIETTETVEQSQAENLPPLLNGAVDYARNLERLPIDQQPFWYLNRVKYNELLSNPQNYPQRGSPFNENGTQVFE